MGKWTDQGFVANQPSYYKTAIQQVFVEAFGEDFDLDDNLPQGVLIQRLAELFYGMDMDGVEAFSRLNLNTMGGLFLDIVGNWRGIPRVLGAPQSGLVSITCNANTFSPFTIPQGTVFVVTETGDRFETINEGGDTMVNTTGTVRVQFTENGNSSALVGNTMSADTIPQITNIEIVALFDGTDNESDIAYRTRLQKDYPAAQNTIEFILNKMRAVVGVRAVGVLYNDTDTTDGNGVPPYATEFMYASSTEDAGAISVINSEIAKIIVDNKTPGAPTHGTITETTTDIFGESRQVKFTKATPVRINIYVQVATPETTGMLDLVNRETITDTIANYINNLDIGKDISYSRCMAPLTADVGFDVVDFAIQKDDGTVWYDKENVTIGDKEYAVFENLTISPNPKPDLTPVPEPEPEPEEP